MTTTVAQTFDLLAECFPGVARVQLVGTAPLLMHNPLAMAAPRASRKTIPEPEDEARAARYLSSDGTALIVYDYHVHRCLIDAAKGYRSATRKPLSQLIAGHTRVTPSEIPTGRAAEDYEVDVRRVVVQKRAIMRARARVWPWSLAFQIRFNPDIFERRAVEELLPEMLRNAGATVGLLDYRPQRLGPFGTFRLVGYEVEWP